MRGFKESAVAFFKRGGHNHDGSNSTKVDFSKYTPEDVRVLSEILKNTDTDIAGASLGGGDAAEVITGATTSPDGKFITSTVDPPKDLVASGDIFFKGTERVFMDIEWSAPPVRDFYYDEYYFDYYYPHDFGDSVDHYEVALQKEGEPLSDHRTVTRNTSMRFWDVDPAINYRIYVWAVNSMNYQSLYATTTTVTPDINTVYVSEKNRSIIENGGFEDGLTWWTFYATGGTFSIDTATWVYEGTNSLKYAGTAGDIGQVWSNLIPVTPGLKYDFSYYAVSTNAGITINTELSWLDEDNNIISVWDYGTYDTLNPSGASSDEFNRRPLDIEFPTAPVNAVGALLVITIDAGSTGDTYIDNVRFEEVSSFEGAVLHTDSTDQVPRVDIAGHYHISAPRERSYAGATSEDIGFHPRVTFDETYTDKNLGHQERLILSSGVPQVADTALYTNHDVGESQLVLLSSPSDPTLTDGQGRSELRYHENFTDDSKNIYSLPLGLVAYGYKSTDETGIGATERILITTSADTTYYSDRVYRFTYNTGYMLFSDTGTIFTLRFDIDSVTRQGQRITGTYLHQNYASHTALWSPSTDVTGVSRVTLQRTAGTGTVDVMLTGTNYMFFGVEDVGSQYIHDLNP